MNKIFKIYKEAKLNEFTIDSSMDPIEILRLAEDQDNLYPFRKDICFTAYKTILPDSDESIVFVFTIKLPNITTGSSASSELVMGVVGLLEKLLSPIHEYKFYRNIDGVNKSIAILKIVKKLKTELYN